MKRIMVAVLAFVMMLSVFGGCNSKTAVTQKEENTQSASSEDPKKEAAEKKDVTLTFGTHQNGLPQSGIVQEIGKDYETETGVKIDFQITPDAQWRDMLKVKLNANEAPDIFCADADPLSLYTRVRPDINCVDLTNEEFVSRMDPGVLPSVSYDNKVYAITFPGKKIWIYAYNKKIFEDLNLEIPTTYEEFKSVCQTIKDAGITPIYEATQNGWHQVLPLFETGPLYDKSIPDLYNKLNNNTMTVKEIPQLLTIIKQLKEFADLGFYGDDFLSSAIEGDKEAFAKGEVAMVLEGIGWTMEVAADYPEVEGNVGIFVMPWGDNQILGINPASNAYFANKNGENVEEVLEFFRYLARPEILKKRFEGDTSQLELCWPEIPARYPKEYSDYLDTLERGTVMQVGVKYIDPQWMDVGKDLEGMYVGGLTPEQIVEMIQQRRDEQAKLQKDPAWN